MASAWQAMRNPDDDKLPGVRGVFAVLLEPPIVDGTRHFVHLSWQGENYVIRDFIQGRERKQGDDLPLARLWQSAKVRIACKGRFRRSIEDHAFWKQALQRLTDEYATTHEVSVIPAKLSQDPRPVGLGKGLIEMDSSFFDPLPPDLLAAFNGKEP